MAMTDDEINAIAATIHPPKARNATLGKDSVLYFESADGYVIIAAGAESPTPAGFARKIAETAPDAEKLWKRMDQQERDKLETMNEAEFIRREATLSRWRNNLLIKKVYASPFERDFIDAAIQAAENKLRKMTERKVTGVAGMQMYEESKRGDV